MADPRVWSRARRLGVIYCRRFARSHLPAMKPGGGGSKNGEVSERREKNWASLFWSGHVRFGFGGFVRQAGVLGYFLGAGPRQYCICRLWNVDRLGRPREFGRLTGCRVIDMQQENAAAMKAGKSDRGEERGEGRRGGGGNKRKKCRGQRAECGNEELGGVWGKVRRESGMRTGKANEGSGGNGVENAERTKVEKPGGRNSEERDGGDRWKKKEQKKEKK